MLPLVLAGYQVLKARSEAAKKPESGWVFPADTPSGHIEGRSGKNYHGRALLAIATEAKEKGRENPVRSFPPYTMRHNALTRLGGCCDPYTRPHRWPLQHHHHHALCPSPGRSNRPRIFETAGTSDTSPEKTYYTSYYISENA
jgi:hypothetical protein